jgi:hypothetical protein
MAAPAQGRRRSTRQEVDLNAQRPVELRESRRFLTSSGSDKATREAQALSNAFGAGTQLASALTAEQNLEGEQDAIVANAKGLRDAQNQNFAYNKKWEEMNAERDYNLLEKTLREKLRGADWENLEESQVQQIITDEMAGMLAGAENLEHYSRAVAPKLTELENTLIGAHRENWIEEEKAKDRSLIFTNISTRFEASKGPEGTGPGVFNYEYLGEATDTMFDAAEKRETYWATIFDFAIRNGRPDIILDTPERFGDEKSDLTRSEDPLFQDKMRAAVTAATTKAALVQKEKDEATIAAADQSRFDLQMEIYRRGQNGQPVGNLIEQMTRIPNTTLAHVTAAKNFADSQFSENESRSPQFAQIGQLYANIHTGVGTAADQMAAVFDAVERGDLGRGKTGVENMNALIAKIEQYQTQGETLRKQSVAWNRTSINTRYNDATGGLLKGINPLMQRVKIDANDMYNDLILRGTDPQTALNDVIKVFDQQVANNAQVEEAEIVSRRAQQDFTAERVTLESIENAIEQGDATELRGIPRYILEDKLITMQDSGTLTDDHINAFVAVYNQ